KHFVKAQTDFERALTFQKEGSRDRLVTNLVELGQLLARQDQHQAALACLDKALVLQPEFVLAQRFRAEAVLALKKPDEAGQGLDAYLAATKPAPADAYLARGLIYAGSGQLPAAIEMYTLALVHNPRDTETRCYRGWTYLLTDAVQLGLE